jgi:hypothetical protein
LAGSTRGWGCGFKRRFRTVQGLALYFIKTTPAMQFNHIAGKYDGFIDFQRYLYN